MAVDREFYICPVCFDISSSPGSHHGRLMIHCKDVPAGDAMLLPEFFLDGNLKSRAPRWFLQSVREAAGLDLVVFDDHHF
jgi:hypothetical protein